MTDVDVPALDTPRVLGPHQADRFRADGHTVVRGLADAGEVVAFAGAIEAATVERAWDKRPLEERDTYGKAFLQAFNLWRVDPVVDRFVRSPRFARVAAELLGVEGVRLYHDQALFKEPGGGHTPWHQDHHYWPLDTDATVTMWMPLVEVPAEVGSMTFVTGSHLVEDLRGPGISDESEALFDDRIAELGLPLDTHGAMAAGDATFHNGWTVHRAGPNPTTSTRAVMTVIYFADGTCVSPTVDEAQELDRRAWLGGLDAGALITSERNPLLWPVN